MCIRDRLYTASLRNVPSLVSQDLDGDGIVEIPTQPDEAGLLNMSQSRRMDFIVWMDYTSPHPEKSMRRLWLMFKRPASSGWVGISTMPSPSRS